MMKEPSKFVSAAQVFLGLTFLCQVFLQFQSALRYEGPENNYLADNWGTLLVFLLPVIFGLGWLAGRFVGRLVIIKGRKIAALALAGLILMFVSIEFASLALFPLSFIGYAMMASGHMLISGFFLRFSMVSSEFSKQQNRD